MKTHAFRTGQLQSSKAAAIRYRSNAATKSCLTSQREKEGAFGNTVCCVIWPDKLASGAPRICDRYMPETVTTIDALRHRTDELGSRRALDAFLSSLERCFDGYVLRPPVPIAIVLCARRPFHLIGSPSDIELLPYIVELRAAAERDLTVRRRGRRGCCPGDAA